MAVTETGPSRLRARIDLVPGKHRPKRVRNGALFVAASLIFLWIIYTKPSLPFVSDGGTKLTAELAYGANVRPGYTPVRVHGVEVGQVTGIERAPSGRGVKITMRIDDGTGVKLHADAGLAVRWRTLLGRNMYVDLSEGSPSAPPLRGGFIPRSHTSDQVELDTALEPFDAAGRAATKTAITEFDRGFADPAAVRGTVDAVAPAMRPLGRATAAMRGTQPGTDLPRLVAGSSRAMGALTRDEVALGGLIDNADIALGVTAARRADLAATLASAPGTLRDTRATMTRLESTLDQLDPLATKLRPGAAKLAPAAVRTQRVLADAIPLLRDLRPTLRDLRPAVGNLRVAAVAGTPAFGPLTATLNRTRDTFIPWLKERNRENKRPNYQNIGPALASVSTATSWGDKNGPVANFEAAAGENAVISSPCNTEVSDPSHSTADKVSCELLARAVAALLLGRNPKQVRFGDSAVPDSVLAPFLGGNAMPKARGSK
jgi:virulence factor Mce-like protein